MQIPVCGFERYGWARQPWQRQRQRCKPGVLGRLNHIILFACLLCQGCVQIPGSIPAPAMPADPVPAQRFVFRDGGSAQFFTIDKQLSSGPALPAETLVFFVSGSDCASMQYFLPGYFRGLEGESGPIRIFILQKRFIDPHTWGRDVGCSHDFVKADHFSRWLADQTEFISTQLVGMRAQPARKAPQRIVIAGVSEGGEVVPALARSIPGVTHAVIIGNGGMDPIDAYRLLLAMKASAQAARALAALESLPRHASDSDKVSKALGGRTWRYWMELAALHHTENLLALSIPLYVAVGAEDSALPVAAATYLRDQFELHGKDNLHLRIYDGADHGLKTNSHANLSDFWFKFDLDMRK